MIGSLDHWLVVAVASWCLWTYLHRRSVNSSLDKILAIPSKSILYGNLPQLFGRHTEKFHRELTIKYGTVHVSHGLFNRKRLYIADPKAIHSVLIKEESVFEETTQFFKINAMTFGPGLLSTTGEWHRKQRKLLNPAFSVKHMHDLLPIFYDVTHRLRDAMAAQVRGAPKELDVLNWMVRTALELIGQGGMGYSFDPLVEEIPNAYGEAMKGYVPALSKVYMFTLLLPRVFDLVPAWFRRQVANAIAYGPIAEVKKAIDTMHENSTRIYEAKKEALLKGDEALKQQSGAGKDLMSILIKANMQAAEADRLPEVEVLAQISTLTFAAMDTTSNALSRILHLLCRNQDVQEKLRAELLAANAGELLTYEELNRLPFLDAVCRETLRVYPPVAQINRVSNADSVIPLSEPIRGTDGKMINEVLVAKGTEVIIGIMNCNTSQALWGDDAQEWKPERWLSRLPEAVTEASIPGVYSNLMTFAGGKRACIGFKFSELEMKVVLSVLLTNFRFELPEKPIFWNVSGIWYPSAEMDGGPKMPLKVTLLK